MYCPEGYTKVKAFDNHYHIQCDKCKEVFCPEDYSYMYHECKEDEPKTMNIITRDELYGR